METKEKRSRKGHKMTEEQKLARREKVLANRNARMSDQLSAQATKAAIEDILLKETFKAPEILGTFFKKDWFIQLERYYSKPQNSEELKKLHKLQKAIERFQNEIKD